MNSTLFRLVLIIENRVGLKIKNIHCCVKSNIFYQHLNLDIVYFYSTCKCIWINLKVIVVGITSDWINSNVHDSWKHYLINSKGLFIEIWYRQVYGPFQYCLKFYCKYLSWNSSFIVDVEILRIWIDKNLLLFTIILYHCSLNLHIRLWARSQVEIANWFTKQT